MLRKTNILGPAMQITRRKRAKVDARILGVFLYVRFHGPPTGSPRRPGMVDEGFKGPRVSRSLETPTTLARPRTAVRERDSR
jgi:hypothetical protein